MPCWGPALYLALAAVTFATATCLFIAPWLVDDATPVGGQAMHRRCATAYSLVDSAFAFYVRVVLWGC